MTAALLLAAIALSGQAPRLPDLHVTNGDVPFAGDRRLLATVSPNEDGFRDEAVVEFMLARAATVSIEAVATNSVRAGESGATVVWRAARRFPAGPCRFVWRPARSAQPRTYILRLRIGARLVGGTSPVVRVQGVDASFTRRSYAPGESAVLRLATDARTLRLQVFSYQSPGRPSEQDVKTSGVAKTDPIRVDWSAHRDAPGLLRVVRAGDWPSGLYFLRATAGDGRVGYAPFIVRPRRLGEHRVAVVLATNTWAAYNFADADGDGWGDSWYVTGRVRSVDLERPFLDFGVPFRFHDWDLDFIAWLNRTGRAVDFLSDDDLEAVASGDELAKHYDLVVFPGHEEYVTGHAYDVVERYRDLGGNLAFLAANNLYRRVDRVGERLFLRGLWRKLGRPEAGVVGVQYVGSDHGQRQAGYTVTGAASAPWAFVGSGLVDGASFGRYGIEIDSRTSASPRGIQVLARIPDLLGPGRSAEMTYYETAVGAKVFAAGTLNFAASLERPDVDRLLTNVLNRLSVP
ncbi:MAG TPA: N,N-dimethylformamidase beta subunit family domain-containing protein [Gaiellaceae bacterium]